MNRDEVFAKLKEISDRIDPEKPRMMTIGGANLVEEIKQIKADLKIMVTVLVEKLGPAVSPPRPPLSDDPGVAK